jgi:hypothetical protein
MTDKTIPEIKAAYSATTTEIVQGWHDTLDEIKAEREPEAGAYLERLTDAQRQELLSEQKGTRRDEERHHALEHYRDAHERYEVELSKRANYLRERLYKVESTTALSNAATSDEEGLSAMLNIASIAGDKTLARAVFVAADSRGLGEVVARFFDEVDPEGRELYQEWREAPSAEVLERQRAGIDTIIHRPDVHSLMPAPQRIGAY